MFFRFRCISCLSRFSLAGSKLNIRLIYSRRDQTIDPWIFKVICTLCARSQIKELEFFREVLDDNISFEVVKSLNDSVLALKFFEFSRVRLGIVHSAATYRLIVKILCKKGLYEQVKTIFSLMIRDGHNIDSSLLGVTVSSSWRADKFDVGMELLVQGRTCNSKVDLFVTNNLLNILVENNRVDEAVFLCKGHFSTYFSPKTCTFNIIIKGLCKLGDFDQALDLLNTMGRFGCCPNDATYDTLLNGLCGANVEKKGYDLQKEMNEKHKGLVDAVTFSSIISRCCKLGKMKEASSHFHKMLRSGVMPNAMTYNDLIDGYSKIGDMISAEYIYNNMIKDNFLPNKFTFQSLIDGYCRNLRMDKAVEVLQEMFQGEILPNDHTFFVIFKGLCKLQKLRDAHDLLRQLNQENIIYPTFVYNLLIDGFCKAGYLDDANMIFAEMEESNCPPNKDTFTILISRNCLNGRTSEAIDLFLKMMCMDRVFNTTTINTLTSCFIKAGLPNEAHHIKLMMLEKILESK